MDGRGKCTGPVYRTTSCGMPRKISDPDDRYDTELVLYGPHRIDNDDIRLVDWRWLKPGFTL